MGTRVPFAIFNASKNMLQTQLLLTTKMVSMKYLHNKVLKSAQKKLSWHLNLTYLMFLINLQSQGKKNKSCILHNDCIASLVDQSRIGAGVGLPTFPYPGDGCHHLAPQVKFFFPVILNQVLHQKKSSMISLQQGSLGWIYWCRFLTLTPQHVLFL